MKTSLDHCLRTNTVFARTAVGAFALALACSSAGGGRRGGTGGAGNNGAACPQLAGTWEVDGEGTNACPITTTCTVTQTGCTFRMSCTDGTTYSGSASNASASFSNSARNCSGPFDDLVDDDGDGEIDPDVEGTCRVEGTTCDFKAECESGACRVAPAGSGSQNEGGGSSGGAANGGSGSEGGASNSPTCRFENDGECDDPTGIGVCPAGTDLADCAASNEGMGGSGGGGDSCPFEDDNECDDPTGTNLCPAGTDLNDCSGESGGESSGSSCSVSDCHNETLCDEFGCLVCSYYCSGDTCVSGGCN